MIACFLNNISAKYYKNPSMLSRVIAKNVGDVFLRHSVFQFCFKCIQYIDCNIEIIPFTLIFSLSLRKFHERPKDRGGALNLPNSPWLRYSLHV